MRRHQSELPPIPDLAFVATPQPCSGCYTGATQPPNRDRLRTRSAEVLDADAIDQSAVLVEGDGGHRKNKLGFRPNVRVWTLCQSPEASPRREPVRLQSGESVLSIPANSFDEISRGTEMTIQLQNSMFSVEQHDLFRTVGFVRLEGAVPLSDVKRMRDRAWALLEQQGFAEMDRATWRPGPVSQLKDLKSGEQPLDENPIVAAALDVVFGEGGWVSPSDWGQPLVTFPKINGTWLMPSSAWHFDHLYFHPGEITGVNVFLLINDVEPPAEARWSCSRRRFSRTECTSRARPSRSSAIRTNDSSARTRGSEDSRPRNRIETSNETSATWITTPTSTGLPPE